MSSVTRTLYSRIGKDERGGVLAFIAVTMISILAIMALCIDLAIAFTARGESQRVADASALAGASAFLDYQDSTLAHNTAVDRLYEYAVGNVVRNEPVDSSRVQYQILYDERKVRVWIASQGLGSWFATMLGVQGLQVRAMAAAEVSPFQDEILADQCILPFTAPDLWDDDADANGNHIPDAEEDWTWDPETDTYHPYSPEPPAEYGTYAPDEGTGYGSRFRTDVSRDYGRQMYIKTAPKGQQGKGSGDSGGELDDMIDPGNFTIWRMPDPDQNCAPQAGAEWVHANITQCNACPIVLGEEYPQETQPGNIASVKDSLQSLIDRDPDAYWDEGCNGGVGCIKNSSAGDHLAAVESSPRVRIVALFAPDQYLQGQTNITFNNFVKVFVEGGGLVPPDFGIYVRMIGPVQGTGGADPGDGGSLILRLRLVE